jgi:Sulfotransferase family
MGFSRIAVQDDPKPDRKYVFICGMPRSGTSMLGRNVGRLADCTDLKNTGTIEDEGQNVQNVYPTAHELGGPGRFGFDARAHRTESSTLLTPENVAQLKASWHRYWDNTKRICIEKTPANLLATRFLQAAFANSYFIVIRRHPVPVAIAAQKWKVNVTSLHNMFEHWLHCHELFEQDKTYLRRVYELRYEDYVEDQDKYDKEIAAFIGTEVPGPPKEDTYRYVTQWRNPTGLRVPEKGMEKASPIHNQKYLDRWHKLLTESPFKVYYRYLARKYESEFNQYGYSLVSGLPDGNEVLREEGMIVNMLGVLSCLAADTQALMWRAALRCRYALRRIARGILPEPILVRIRQARQRRCQGREKRIQLQEVKG